MTVALPTGAPPVGLRIAPTGKAVLTRAWLPICLVALWHLFASALDSLYIPTPTVVATTFWEEWSPFTSAGRDNLAANLVPTLRLILSGWACSALIGVPVGLAVGRVTWVAALLNPIIRFGMNVPPPILLPLIIVLFGFGTSGKLTLIIVGTMWPILMNTILAAQSIDPVIIKTARTLDVSPFTFLTRILLPSATPAVFSGLRVALSISVMLAVIAEMYTAESGVGHAIVSAQVLFEIPEMWAGIVMLAVIGVGLNGLFVLVERRVLFWHEGTRLIDAEPK